MQLGMIDESLSRTVLSAALHERFNFRGEDDFAEFAGHLERAAA